MKEQDKWDKLYKIIDITLLKKISHIIESSYQS